MPYVLEGKKESERLEKQSRFPKYDYAQELRELELKPGSRALDAGCGSGVVARYLADRFPGSRIQGCDFSKERVEFARASSRGIANAEYSVEDLTRLSFGTSAFDAIVCRYVVEHLTKKDVARALKQMLRCLKPGSALHAIDFDGPVYNLFPQPKFVARVIEKMKKQEVPDLRVGRKIPRLMVEAGFSSVDWRIETVQCKGELLEQEKELMAEKFEGARKFLIAMAGSAKGADRFVSEYLGAMNEPGVTLFYNKFIVIGRKP